MLKQKEETPVNANGWLASFIDLIMLLITFFIMIYAALQERNDEDNGVMKSIQGRFSLNKNIQFKGTEVGMLYALLNKNIKEFEMEENIKLQLSDEKVTIGVAYSDIFNEDDGSLKVNSDIMNFLNQSLYNMNMNKIDISNVINIDKVNKQKYNDDLNISQRMVLFFSKFVTFAKSLKGLDTSKTMQLNNHFIGDGEIFPRKISDSKYADHVININIYSEKE